MVAFAIAYRIAGLFVPDTNAVMVAVHGIISLCGIILMFFTIATVASVIYSKLCDDRAIAERFAKPQSHLLSRPFSSESHLQQS